MKDTNDFFKQKQLSFYQVIMEGRLKNALDFNHLIITLSVALIAVLPNLYNSTNSPFYFIALIMFLCIVILGIIEYRLDYYQLGSLEKQNQGEKSFNFAPITLRLLCIKLTLFVIAIIMLICLAFFDREVKIQVNEEVNNVVEEYQCKDQTFAQDDLSDFNPPMPENPKPKK